MKIHNFEYLYTYSVYVLYISNKQIKQSQRELKETQPQSKVWTHLFFQCFFFFFFVLFSTMNIKYTKAIKKHTWKYIINSKHVLHNLSWFWISCSAEWGKRSQENSVNCWENHFRFYLIKVELNPKPFSQFIAEMC